MLNNDDRNAIEGLFRRLSDVERKAPPRDPEAEELIRDEISRQPGAPYYMAQTILVQEHALSIAEQRIRDFEAEIESGPRPEQRPRRPWDRQDRNADRGGGFLAGAAQTALGVTGGILIGSAIAGMLGAGAATAAEAPAEDVDQNTDTDSGSDDLGGGDAGGFGDGGGFDFGGGF